MERGIGNKVYDILQNNPNRDITSDFVLDVFSGQGYRPKRDSVNNALNHLVTSGKAARVGYGQFRLASQNGQHTTGNVQGYPLFERIAVTTDGDWVLKGENGKSHLVKVIEAL